MGAKFQVELWEQDGWTTKYMGDKLASAWAVFQSLHTGDNVVRFTSRP